MSSKGPPPPTHARALSVHPVISVNRCNVRTQLICKVVFSYKKKETPMTVINFYLQEFFQEEHHLKFIPFTPEVRLSYPFPFFFGGGHSVFRATEVLRLMSINHSIIHQIDSFYKSF